MKQKGVEMISSTKNRVNFILSIILSGFILLACANYPNDPRNPKVSDDTYTVEEDGFLPVSAEEGILSNDKPEEGSQAILLTVGEQATDQDGLVVMSEDGSFTYEPAANFNGTDKLNYLIKNAKGKQSNGTVFFEVSAVNDPPHPKDDVIPTATTDPVVINVLQNDVDPDGDNMHLVSVDALNMGNAEINNNNEIVFTPPANHIGDIKFKYIVADTADERAEAWVSLTVVDENNSIVATPDSMTVTEDVPGTMAVSSLLANDQDLLNGTLSVIELGAAQNGTALLNRNRATLTYTPNPDFSGTDTFTYTVLSDTGSTASSLVNITITPVNDPPTISQIEDQNINAGQTTDPIPFTLEDLDNGTAELNVNAGASRANPANLLPPNGITLGGRGAHRTIRIISRPNIVGSVTINIVVDDGELRSTESFRLTTSLPTPVSVILYWDDNFSGATLTLNSDINCLVANGWNDQVSSVRVIGGQGDFATIYKHCEYGGYAINLPVGAYTLPQLQTLGALNDDISSVRVTDR
jgi:hypothetical protein